MRSVNIHSLSPTVHADPDDLISELECKRACKKYREEFEASGWMSVAVNSGYTYPDRGRDWRLSVGGLSGC